MIVRDYLTETQKLFACTRGRERIREDLLELYDDSKPLFGKYILSDSLGVPDVVEYLMRPQTRRRVNAFNQKQWLAIGHKIAKLLKKKLGEIPEPRILFYPGFQAVNGMVVWMDKKPVIVLSPDFGFFSDEDNIKVLLTHEYGHFLRSEAVGMDYSKLPVHGLIYEEGIATYITSQVWPDVPTSVVFMANLHRKVGLTDPKGGYIRWCRKNLKTVAEFALQNLDTKESDAAWRMFQGGRVTGDDSSPVRTGYYLGHETVRHMATKMNLRDLLNARITQKMIRKAIDEMIL